MNASAAPRDYRTNLAIASLVVGPFLMTVGDLFHPEESLDNADQAAIIIEHAQRWYAAHLLLFVGFVLFVPGVLALTELAASRRARSGYAARVLVLAGALAVSAIFVGEMVVGWYAEDGADVVAVTNLLETLFSGAIAAAVVPVGLAFFVGVMVFALPVVRDGGPHRWPAIVFAVGSLLILAEIISGEVLLSQVGNALMFVGSAWFAWLLFRGEWPGRQAAGGDDRR